MKGNQLMKPTAYYVLTVCLGMIAFCLILEVMFWGLYFGVKGCLAKSKPKFFGGIFICICALVLDLGTGIMAVHWGNKVGHESIKMALAPVIMLGMFTVLVIMPKLFKRKNPIRRICEL